MCWKIFSDNYFDYSSALVRIRYNYMHIVSVSSFLNVLSTHEISHIVTAIERNWNLSLVPIRWWNNQKQKKRIARCTKKTQFFKNRVEVKSLMHNWTSTIRFTSPEMIINISLYFQVKVWFQNRRTKYKRDKTRETDNQGHKAESLATCNILRLLQGHSSRVYNTCSPYLHSLPYGYSQWTI